MISNTVTFVTQNISEIKTLQKPTTDLLLIDKTRWPKAQLESRNNEVKNPVPSTMTRIRIRHFLSQCQSFPGKCDIFLHNICGSKIEMDF